MLPLDRMWVRSTRARLWRWLLDEIVHAPLEPILHPSRARLLWVGFAIVVGNILFGVIWGAWMPQPYENFFLRCVAACLGLFFFVPSITIDCTSRRTAWVFSVICWLALPAYFFWMYWMNGRNPVWLASVSAMIVIYHHLTDWRLASFGSVVALLFGWLLANSMREDPTLSTGLQVENAVVIGFSWVTSILLGFSSANLRRTRLINTLSTMGVMAHELRTPLATVNLMGDVLRNLAQNDLPENKRRKLEELSTRLQNLVRSMNRQIDTQISNAQLLRLPRERSAIMAAELVHEVVGGYPYRSSRERDCVQVHLQQDFCFVGSRPLFAQVLENLIKNALHSLASVGTAPRPGDLRIDIGLHHGKGRIAVSDQGLGIAHEKQARIFEPFFSTQGGVGSGLGLTFCKNVVQTVHGQLSVHSEPAEGAVFMIDLPLNANHAD